jgi:hypothetical protein
MNRPGFHQIRDAGRNAYDRLARSIGDLRGLSGRHCGVAVRRCAWVERSSALICWAQTQPVFPKAKEALEEPAYGIARPNSFVDLEAR